MKAAMLMFILFAAGLPSNAIAGEADRDWYLSRVDDLESVIANADQAFLEDRSSIEVWHLEFDSNDRPYGWEHSLFFKRNDLIYFFKSLNRTLSASTWRYPQLNQKFPDLTYHDLNLCIGKDATKDRDGNWYWYEKDDRINVECIQSHYRYEIRPDLVDSLNDMRNRAGAKSKRRAQIRR